MLKLTPTEHVEVESHTADALVVLATYLPGGQAPPPHRHPHQDERFEVLEGVLRAEVDGVSHVLAAGDTLDVPCGAAHKMGNDGDVPAKVRWTTMPAGRTLEWFTALDAAGDGEKLPSVRTFLKLLAQYEDVLQLAVGPPKLTQGAVRVLARI